MIKSASGASDVAQRIGPARLVPCRQGQVLSLAVCFNNRRVMGLKYARAIHWMESEFRDMCI
jgi:hypothetical protein